MNLRPEDLHKEKALQLHLVQQLVALQGYEERHPSAFDRALALDKELTLRFVRATQPNEWDQLERHHGGQAEDELFRQLEKNLQRRGTLDVLRQGIKIVPGITFRFCGFQPASGLNPDLVARYEANILSVMQEVEYSARNGNRIDVVLFVNGLPVATLELKNALTGTTYRAAIAQYCNDRPPANEPLLTFKRGALVHFALDQDSVYMTTHLNNGKTRFLPFNRGNDGGAGNPDISGEFPVAYLYQDQPADFFDFPPPAVFGRQVWLAILGRFLHLERGESKGERMIFPRFQQLDAVLKMTAHARAFGPGQRYLIQHSAGSGKSNTIGWAAHQLINLHDDRDEAIFQTAIIVTDRVVLDRQLQETVSQFEQTQGVVQKIDGTSKQLKQAIESGARIIITTIQKFGTDHLKEVEGQASRRFAILIDEAHSSQSGKTAAALTKTLTRAASENEEADDLDKSILDQMAKRGQAPNVSYFAFTATPRNVTLELFSLDRQSPRPFHLYSMRQAIEEGFILDVLKNYTTYAVYYKLEKQVEEDPRFKGKQAQRKVAKYAHLHPTAIGQKVEIIVEHFRRHVMHEMGGQAKAMVVTASREAALKYFLGFRAYLEQSKYTDMRALVAFSGELKHEDEVWTEAQLNGFSESQLPAKFDGETELRLLIVAEKYQTGFDQPKLCAMYVDRKLAGLQAVQTLSRLNRTAPGKERTYILDFQNSIEDIQAAFAPYYQQTELSATTDPSQIFELESKLYTYGVLDKGEIARFAETYFKPKLKTPDRAALERLVKAAVERFNWLGDASRQEEFRQHLKSYLRFYDFITQIVPFSDVGLEKLSVYGDWLNRLLPDREAPDDAAITKEMLRLQAFRVEEQENGSASLPAGTSATLSPIEEFAAKPYTEEEERSLSELIETFNERHGTQFTREDFLRFERVNREVMSADMIEMMRNNPPDVVFTAFSEAFFKGLVRTFKQDANMKNILMTDAAARERLISLFFGRALSDVRAGV